MKDIVLPKRVVNHILATLVFKTNACEMTGLMVFYYFLKVNQKKNPKKDLIRCRTSFAATVLGISVKKVRRIKNKLKELNLIEDVTLREDGKKISHYIRIKK